VNDHFLPTEREQAKIAKIAAWRKRLQIVVFVPVLVLVLDRLFLGYEGWVLTALAVGLFVLMLSLIVYTSFLLRCPRCSTWVSVGVPKCATCGLKYDVTKSNRFGAASQ
jgi:hypothetical protein